VVLLDPDTDTRDATAALLSRWNCRVLASAALEQALVDVAALKRPPDLLISSFRLGLAEGDGIAAIERLRDEFNSPLPALILSADISIAARKAVADAQCLFVAKPVERAALHRQLAGLLHGDAAEAEVLHKQ
jgi:CheY-like chemotaxis protein